MSGTLIAILAAAAAVSAVCVILLIWRIVRRRRRRTEEKKYYDAAARMIKENCLDEIIRSRGQRNPVIRRLMIYIRVRGSEPQGFVFDPEAGIRIGRDPMRNEICIRDGLVSASHCCIYLQKGRPVIRDYQSTNGTWIRRGMHRMRPVEGTGSLMSGDVLRVGDTKMDVKFFVFDMMDL